MNFLKKYATWIEVGINTAIPIIGIIFLNWSIGDIFFLFFIDILFLGGFSGLKILFAAKDSGIGTRIFAALGFGLIYSILFFVILVLAGNFFNGAGLQMDFTVGGDQIKFLLVAHSLNFIFTFLVNGRFKETTYKKVMKETLLRTASLFFVLLAVLLPFSYFIGSTTVNYFLGGGIIFTKNVVDIFIMRKLNKSQIQQKS